MYQQGSYKIVAEGSETFYKYDLLFDYYKHIDEDSFNETYSLNTTAYVAPFHVKVEITYPSG